MAGEVICTFDPLMIARFRKINIVSFSVLFIFFLSASPPPRRPPPSPLPLGRPRRPTLGHHLSRGSFNSKGPPQLARVVAVMREEASSAQNVVGWSRVLGALGRAAWGVQVKLRVVSRA